MIVFNLGSKERTDDGKRFACEVHAHPYLSQNVFQLDRVLDVQVHALIVIPAPNNENK